MTPSGVSDNKKKQNFWFLPGKSFLIFPLIAMIQIIVFAMMTALGGVDAMSPQAASLLDWGGVFRTSVVQDHEYWRLFSTLFVHAGFFHLMMNVLKIWLLGSLVEPALGRSKSLLIYLFGGFTASLFSLTVNDATVVVGSSGAAFAILGALVILLLFRRSILKTWFPTFLLILMLVAVDLVFGSFQDTIDNAAHLGGFLGGLVLGGLSLVGLKSAQSSKRSLVLLGLFGLAQLVSAYYIIEKLDDPVGEYRVAYSIFTEQEDSAMMAFDLPDSASRVLKVEWFEGNMRHWKTADEAFEKLKVHDLPAGVQRRVSDLQLYTKLRYEQFELIGLYYRTLEDRYFDQAEVLSKDIVELRERLIMKRKVVIPE